MADTYAQMAVQHAFIILAYGASEFLPACIASIRNQTRSGSAVVMTTSTPSDYVSQVAREHDVPLIVNPRRDGIGTDWNFALEATSAEHVTLAHQDDLYRPDYWSRMGALIERTGATLAFCDFVETDRSGERPLHLNLKIKRRLARRAFQRRETIDDRSEKRRLLRWGNPIGCPSVVIDRARVPDFRFATDLASNLDWEGWLRLAERSSRFAYLPEPLVVRRIHARSETSALIADRRRIAEDRAMFRQLWPAPMAELIALVYRASYRSNRT